MGRGASIDILQRQSEVHPVMRRVALQQLPEVSESHWNVVDNGLDFLLACQATTVSKLLVLSQEILYGVANLLREVWCPV